MIVANPKPFEEIVEMVKGRKRVLNVGCAGCTAICLTGGQKEVDELNAELKKFFKEKKTEIRFDGYTVERQCEADFISQLDPMKGEYDAMLSMACGAGVQLVADRFPEIPVFPALDTVFVGTTRDVGWYEEKCKSCGDCQLAYTGGICPVTMCAKSLFNGPCGGPGADGTCEVGDDIPCAWCRIFERLKLQGRLDNIAKIKEPMNWRNQIPGNLILEKYKNRYVK